jgi:hypothetical protein
MPTTLLARFLNRFTSDEDNENDSRFVPSRLNWSLRYGTEGGREEANHEIARIQQQADEIEQRRRE